MSGELRNKNVAEPWMREANEKRFTDLPSWEHSLTNIDGSFLNFKKRIGNGDGKSKTYQCHIMVERKWINEELGFSQCDHLLKLHNSLIRPHTVRRRGERVLRNYGVTMFAGCLVRSYGVAVLRMDGETIDTSKTLIWERPVLRLIRTGSFKHRKQFGLVDTQIHEWFRFETSDPKVIWDILSMKLDPNNPNVLLNDRLHHRTGRRHVLTKKSELGFEFEESYTPKS